MIIHSSHGLSYLLPRQTDLNIRGSFIIRFHSLVKNKKWIYSLFFIPLITKFIMNSVNFRSFIKNLFLRFWLQKRSQSLAAVADVAASFCHLEIESRPNFFKNNFSQSNANHHLLSLINFVLAESAKVRDKSTRKNENENENGTESNISPSSWSTSNPLAFKTF